MHHQNAYRLQDFAVSFLNVKMIEGNPFITAFVYLISIKIFVHIICIIIKALYLHYVGIILDIIKRN